MLARRTWLLSIVVLLIFGYGIASLFVLRFSRGDIYPPYSSLRADPLGTKVLHNTLSALDGYSVSRNQTPLRFLTSDKKSTIIYLGVPTRYFLYDDEFATLGKMAAAGHRIVIGLLPEADVPKKPGDKKTEEKIIPIQVAPDLWKLELIKLPKTETPPLQMTGSDQPVSYHSGLGFATHSPLWKTLGSVGKTPVAVERPFGTGSLVLLADSYALSNEALLKERRVHLLTSLLGQGRDILFDETHFGVSEQPGVATLARRYRLQGVAAVSLLLAILFLWRNLTPLFPRASSDTENEIVLQGQNAHSGLIHLLRRSVTPRELPVVALTEWEKSAPPGVSKNLLSEASNIANRFGEPPLSRLARIHTLLTSKKHVKRTS